MFIELVHTDKELIKDLPTGNFYFIWEFSIDLPALYAMEAEQVYGILKETSILNDIVYEVEMRKKDLFNSEDYSGVIYDRPFLFDYIPFTDFDAINSMDEFKECIKPNYHLSMDEVSGVDVLEGLDDLYNRIIDNVSKRVPFKNPLWHISKAGLLHDEETKLSEINDFHGDYELFFEIDAEQQLIRIIEMGDD